MAWNIEYFNDRLANKILKLPPGILARYLHLTELMREFGPNLGMPHTRSFGEKLFELRMKSKEGIGWIFYCIKVKNKIIMLHSFIKKTQRTPQKELKIARKRLAEVLENES